MKKLDVLFLVFLSVMAFSYSTSLPDSIELSRGIEMVLYLSDGGECDTLIQYIVLPEGTYSTMEEAADHSPEAGTVRTVPESYEEFFKPEYATGILWNNATALIGMDCYYFCGFDAAMPHCEMRCHDRDYTYYNVNVYKNNENLGDSTELGIVFNDTIDVAQALIPVMEKCEAPNNVPPEPTPEPEDTEELETAEIISNAAETVAEEENGTPIETAEVALACASEAYYAEEYGMAELCAENAVLFASAANMELSESEKDLMNDAANAINEAANEIAQAQLDGTDTAQAQDLLASASSSFGSGDYADAEAFAQSAQSTLNPDTGDDNKPAPQEEDIRELFFKILSTGSIFIILLLLIAVAIYYLRRRNKK